MKTKDVSNRQFIIGFALKGSCAGNFVYELPKSLSPWTILTKMNKMQFVNRCFLQVCAPVAK